MLACRESDGEVIQIEHSCQHGDTICHPKSVYVTTKLHRTSKCGCNNNAIFSDIAIFTFLTGSVCRPKYWRVMPKLNDGSTVQFIIFRVQDVISA